MSTWVAIEIDGFSVMSFQNHHSTWFFRNHDRVREVYGYAAGDEQAQTDFIGYRATAATIRRRMTLAGYDLRSCEAHFRKCLDKLINEAQYNIGLREASLQKGGHPEETSAELALDIEKYQKFIDAIKDTVLEDWIALFPEAVKLERQTTGLYSFRDEVQWFEGSDVPLLCAMLSFIPLYPEYQITDLFNFPANDSVHFITAFLASCPDDAVCELNIAELISAGYEADFTDLEEIQQGTTIPFRNFRQSLDDLAGLSSLKPDDQVLQRMCFSSIITAMEAYLSDIMKREVLQNEAIKRRFVEKYSKFEKEKLSVPQLYHFLDSLDERISEELDNTSFHNIQTAKNMFRDVLLIDFPEAVVPDLSRAVIKRHDIVHRNGKNTGGHPLVVTFMQVSELMNIVREFVAYIDKQVLDGLITFEDDKLF
ncbi:HEPN/Toprim-associated domain-containing protein [Cronobacter sakazakii]|uniref:HEPN/Toprim-associated domain-containing protein n=1 Tax=Cronobacter sakazakii TaxID=28141 RepID=UPI001576F87A|nr:HEPN/Toprim-associated domain-containing protein [Cronobacter sakazakii]MEB8610292.1 HEPN/Toprim-associated domain-containing protein [Cronobacter sakazakii]